MKSRDTDLIAEAYESMKEEQTEDIVELLDAKLAEIQSVGSGHYGDGQKRMHEIIYKVWNTLSNPKGLTPGQLQVLKDIGHMLVDK
jgi:beta-xylosidase